MVRRSIALVPALAVLALSAACSGTASPPGSGDTPTPRENEGLTIEVQNDNPGDFDIYFVRAGTSLRLGTITGRSARFQVDRARFNGQGQVTVIARSLVGSQEFESRPVLVSRGEYVLLQLSEQLGLSRVSVRR